MANTVKFNLDENNLNKTPSDSVDKLIITTLPSPEMIYLADRFKEKFTIEDKSLRSKLTQEFTNTIKDVAFDFIREMRKEQGLATATTKLAAEYFLNNKSQLDNYTDDDVADFADIIKRAYIYELITNPEFDLLIRKIYENSSSDLSRLENNLQEAILNQIGKLTVYNSIEDLINNHEYKAAGYLVKNEQYDNLLALAISNFLQHVEHDLNILKNLLKNATTKEHLIDI